FHAIARLQKLRMEAIEEGREPANAENNPVAARSPRPRQYIASLVLIQDLGLSGIHRRERQAGTDGTGGRRASGHELLARRTERRHCARKPQVIVRIAAERLLERDRASARALIEHNAFAIGRPGGAADSAGRPLAPR